MEPMEIFALQFALSFVVIALLARWYAGPLLNRLDHREALFWLTVPHAFRHLGMVFLVPGVVAPTMPVSFSAAAAYGDLAAGLLAIVALIALHRRWVAMIPLAWLFNVVGLLDLANALSHAEAVPHFQSAWYIPTFVVPLLLVTHFMALGRLWARLRSSGGKLAEG
ncbi:hypothetical protein [Pelagibius sp.]|uniref:hypothetical protein n=1 Tax=Pelagibius sp. TaxID=1931238 RepID=UPI002638E0EF|nr:hypothetical protein [Pelagibius sp.]